MESNTGHPLGAAPRPVIVADALYRETEAADLIGISVPTLQKWRVRTGNTNPGLPHCKIGRSVRYRGKDILDLIERSMRISTSSGAC